MSTSIAHTQHRVLAGLLACVLVLAGLAFSASPASAAESQRLEGVDRYATSVDVSQATFDASTTDVIVARGDGRAFADALAASGVAGAVNAPVLLTHIDVAPAVVLAEIERLDPDTVHIAGGVRAVSAAAEAAIDAVTDATITRYPGENRYDTAAMLADAIGGAGDVNELATALIATGRDFPDALAGGPLAYAGGHPILLVDTNIVPAETTDALTDLGVEQVVILGGTTVVSGSVESQLEDLVGNDAIRLRGIDRFETAATVADFAVDELGFTTTEVLLARSHLAADALSGGPYGGVNMAPIVLTRSNSLHPTTAAWLTANSPDMITVLGGSAAVSDAVVAAAVAAAEAGAAAEDAIAAAEDALAEAATALAAVEDVATAEAAVTAAEAAVAAADAALAAAEASGDAALITAAEGLQTDAAAALAAAEAALVAEEAAVTGPSVVDVTFSGGTIFGNNVTADELVITYDEPVELGLIAGFAIDEDGDGAEEWTYTCGADVNCSKDAENRILILPTSSILTTWTTIEYGVSTLHETTGVTDPEGNGDTGFPELIAAAEAPV